MSHFLHLVALFINPSFISETLTVYKDIRPNIIAVGCPSDKEGNKNYINEILRYYIQPLTIQFPLQCFCKFILLILLQAILFGKF